MTIATASTNLVVTTDIGTTASGSHTLVSGSNRMIVLYMGGEPNSASARTVNVCTYGGVSMTLATSGEAITGSGFRTYAYIYYLLEADLPSDGSNTVSVEYSGNMKFSFCCAQYTGVKQGTPEDTDVLEEGAPADNTLENSIAPTDIAWVFSAMCGDTNRTASVTHGQSQVEVMDTSPNAGCTVSGCELQSANGETSLDSTWSAGTFNCAARVAASFQAAGYPYYAYAQQ